MLNEADVVSVKVTLFWCLLTCRPRLVVEYILGEPYCFGKINQIAEIVGRPKMKKIKLKSSKILGIQQHRTDSFTSAENTFYVNIFCHDFKSFVEAKVF